MTYLSYDSFENSVILMISTQLIKLGDKARLHYKGMIQISTNFKLYNMKMYQLSEQNLFDLLRNSFVAGEEFAEDIQDFEKAEKLKK